MGKVLKVVLFILVIWLAVMITMKAAYAAVGDQTVEYSGDWVIVHTVIAETENSDYATQTIKHEWIPKSQYNGYVSTQNCTPPSYNYNQNWNQNWNRQQWGKQSNNNNKQQNNNWSSLSSEKKVESLRNAAKNSGDDVCNFAKGYRWTVPSRVETYADQNSVRVNIEFKLDDTDQADLLYIVFSQVTSADNAGNIVTKYYNNGIEYSVGSIKDMFKKYGKKL